MKSLVTFRDSLERRLALGEDRSSHVVESASESPGGLVKTDCWAPAPRVSNSVGLGWGLRIAFSNKCSAATALVLMLVLGLPFENQG